MNTKEILEIAEREVLEEKRREAIEQEKQKIRWKYDQSKKWYIRFFPWRLKVYRADELPEKERFNKDLEKIRASYREMTKEALDEVEFLRHQNDILRKRI